MDYCRRVIVFLVLAMQLLERSNGQIGYMEESKSIFKTIFPTYNQNVPPLKDYPNPVLLDLKVNLVHISDLDVISQVLTSTIDLTVSWKDTRLAWNSQNVKEVTVEKQFVWRPELSIDNAVGESVEVEAPALVLKGSGEIVWFRRLQIQTSCPHDQANKTSECNIVMRAGNQLEYKLADFGNLTENTCSSSFQLNNRWDLNMTASKVEDEQIGNMTVKADPEITCTVLLKRKSGCCDTYPSAARSSDTSGGGNNESPAPFHLSGLILLVSLSIQYILTLV